MNHAVTSDCTQRGGLCSQSIRTCVVVESIIAIVVATFLATVACFVMVPLTQCFVSPNILDRINFYGTPLTPP